MALRRAVTRSCRLQRPIRVLRERAGEKRAISVVHTDLPENDFTVLFQTVNGDPQSYLRGDAAVFPSAVGRSFYQQIFPSDSITLGWSSWAAHWLSRCPAAIPDQVQACFSADPGTRAAFARQAADDWVRFLAMRDGELCPGGRFVVLAMALDPASEQSFRALVDATYGGLIDLVDSGFLTRAEVHQMVIPSAPRTREEYLAPFAESGSFGSLRVEKMEIYPAEDVFWRDFEQTKDARRFGAGWAAFSRASAFPSLAKGLEPGGGDGRLAAFLSRLEDAMAARLALRPEPVLIPICKMLVAKDG